MDRREALTALDAADVRYELAEHEAVSTVEQAHGAGIPFAAFGAKNLFVRDDRKRRYYLVTMPDDKRVPLKELQGRIGSRRLSFASPADLADRLALSPGSVTPLGALHDGARDVEVVFDRALVERGRVAVHPCDNTATVLVGTRDLIRLLRGRGRSVRVIDL